MRWTSPRASTPLQPRLSSTLNRSLRSLASVPGHIEARMEVMSAKGRELGASDAVAEVVARKTSRKRLVVAEMSLKTSTKRTWVEHQWMASSKRMTCTQM